MKQLPRQHRVIVQLLDGDLGPPSLSVLTPNASELTTRRSNIEVIDHRTLLMETKNYQSRSHGFRQLHFDYVSGVHESSTRVEDLGIMNKLLIELRNCCLVRVNAMRELQVQYLCNLLVTEVEKRLLMSHGSIQTIKLEYYDVRKYDMVNMLLKASSVENSINNRSKPLVERKTFATTFELLKWLQSEYTLLWASGCGHEIIDLQYCYYDTRHRMKKVKFTLIQLNLSRMDSDTKVNLHKFFESQSDNRKVKNSMLTDCLREYFDAEERWSTWLVFRIPLAQGGIRATGEMLKMASAAYSSTPAKRADVEAKSICDFRLHALEERLTGGKSVTEKMKNRKDLHATMASTNLSKSRLNTAENKKVKQRYSSKDLNSLSNWYCKVDDRFNNVITRMEAYYNREFEAKIARMRVDIKHMVCTFDQESGVALPPETKYDTTRAAEISSIELELSWLYNQYKRAAALFRELTTEMEKSNYGETLKIYLNTKTYELTQHALRLKVKQLETCQKRLSFIINEEINALNVTHSDMQVEDLT